MRIERNAAAIAEAIAGTIDNLEWFLVQNWGGADGFPRIDDLNTNCEASEDSPASLDVIISPGGLFLDDQAYRVPTQQTVTFTDVGATRYDIIQYTPGIDNPFNRKAGTSTPGATTADSGSIIVAEIHLTSGITQIFTVNITDKRVIV
jgi:hypothetical protein